MKLKITKTALLNGLQSVQNVVGTRTTLPILSNVLLRAEKNSLSLTTTDLDLTVQAAVECETAKAGNTTLPVKRLFSIVRELPDGDIEITVDDQHAATLSCGASYFKIVGISEEEFPPIQKPEGKTSFRMEQAVLKEMLRKTSYAASTDETRYILNGTLMSFRGGKLTIVATDGRRLALVEQELDFPKDAEADAILPTKAVSELMHALGDEGDVKIFVREKNIAFELKTTTVLSKLVEGSYPNYRQVIPAQCEERISMERETLLAALRRIALVADERTMAAKFTFAKNRLTITMSSPNVGEAREVIPVKYAGKEINVAFNPDYMMDPLKALANDEVFIELTDDMSPGVIKSDIPFLYVIMPMRIG